MIENDINQKVYIGQTRRTIEVRWSEHKKKSRQNISMQPLYRAMRKYGVEHFKIKEVEHIKNQLLDKREIYYIEKYDSFVPNGYNATLGGDNNPMLYEVNRRKMMGDLNPSKRKEVKEKIMGDLNPAKRPEVREKIRQSRLGSHHSEETKMKIRKNSGNAIGVAKIEIETGKVVKIYPSIAEAARELGKKNADTKISAVCNGKQRTAYGYKWEKNDKRKAPF